MSETMWTKRMSDMSMDAMKDENMAVLKDMILELMLDGYKVATTDMWMVVMTVDKTDKKMG